MIKGDRTKEISSKKNISGLSTSIYRKPTNTLLGTNFFIFISFIHKIAGLRPSIYKPLLFVLIGSFSMKKSPFAVNFLALIFIPLTFLINLFIRFSITLIALKLLHRMFLNFLFTLGFLTFQ